MIVTAANIIRLRRRLNLTQRRAAHRAQDDGLRVWQSEISMMEAGHRPVDPVYADWLVRQVKVHPSRYPRDYRPRVPLEVKARVDVLGMRFLDVLMVGIERCEERRGKPWTEAS